MSLKRMHPFYLPSAALSLSASAPDDLIPPFNSPRNRTRGAKRSHLLNPDPFMPKWNAQSQLLNAFKDDIASSLAIDSEDFADNPSIHSEASATRMKDSARRRKMK